MIWAALVLLLTAAGGTALTRGYLHDASLAVRVVGGAITGWTLLALLGYVVALCVGLNAGSVIFTAVLVGLPAVGIRGLKDAWVRPRLLDLAAYAVLAVFILLVFPQAGYERAADHDPPGAPSIWTADNNNLGDLPYHLGIITAFYPGGNLPPQDIELAGTHFAYPFLADFQTAQWCALGLPLLTAVTMHNCVLALLLAAAMAVLAGAFTGDRRAALLVPWLVLLSGGLGFVMFGDDCGWNLARGWHMLAHLPNNYTIRNDDYRWANAINGLLMPQRSFLLGLPLMLWTVFLLWRQIDQPDGRRAVAAGLCCGALCLAHTYCFMMVVGSSAALTFLFRGRGWKSYWAASATGLPGVLWLAGGVHTSFFAWHLGWDHGFADPISFWLKNTGLFLPLLVWSWRGADRTRLRFYAPFGAWFVIANLFQMAPWIWDNVKMLFPWFVLSAPWVAERIVRLRLPGAVLCVVLLCLSGAMDVWRILSHTAELQLFTGADVAYARQVSAIVAGHPQSVVLHAPTLNSPLFLTGTLAVVGDARHMKSHGVDGGHRAQQIADFYQGIRGDVLANYRVRYVAITPQERQCYHVRIGMQNAIRWLDDANGYAFYQIP